MKKILLLLSIVCAIPSRAAGYIDRPNSVIRIMDKAAGKVQMMTIPVNQETQLEKLHINVRACKQTDPFQAENFFAFVEITKNDEGKIFSGWMNRNEPGQNPLQNADYDVWLVRCQ